MATPQPRPQFVPSNATDNLAPPPLVLIPGQTSKEDVLRALDCYYPEDIFGSTRSFDPISPASSEDFDLASIDGDDGRNPTRNSFELPSDDEHDLE